MKTKPATPTESANKIANLEISNQVLTSQRNDLAVQLLNANAQIMALGQEVNALRAKLAA